MGDYSYGKVEVPDAVRKTKAREMVDYLEGQIRRGKDMGVDFSDVESILMGVEMLLDSEAYSDAEELISQCTIAASQRFTDFELLTANIRKVENEIRRARESGRDISEAAGLLKMARYHFENGNYGIGIDYTKRALDEFRVKKDVEISWGSGL